MAALEPTEKDMAPSVTKAARAVGESPWISIEDTFK